MALVQQMKPQVNFQKSKDLSKVEIADDAAFNEKWLHCHNGSGMVWQWRAQAQHALREMVDI